MTKKEARQNLRNAVSKALAPFDIYGLGVEIPGSFSAIIKASEKFHKEMKKVADID